MAIAWIAWIIILTGIIGAFLLLWRFAERIERDELEERQWREYIAQLWIYDPSQAQYWQYEFERKFLGGK